MYKTFAFKLPQRMILAMLLVLSMFVTLGTSALAAPDEDNSPTSRVIVETAIPDGFSGTIYVMLSTDAGDYYTIMCNKMSDYKGALELPYGEYFVERAYTSEDNLAYEAFVETESFVLNEVYQRLHVAVKYNAAGAEPIAPEEPTVPGDVSTEPDASASQSEPDAPAGPVDTTEPGADSSQGDTSEPSAGDPGQDDEPEPTQSKGALKVVRDIFVTLVAMAVFVGIVCAVVYFVRKREF